MKSKINLDRVPFVQNIERENLSLFTSLDSELSFITREKVKGRLSVSDSLDLNVIRERIAFLTSNTAFTDGFTTGSEQNLDHSLLKGNIENFIGMTQVPTGVMGPVKVRGSHANGEFFVPLATSEGALVASYHRGAKACYEAGGVRSICVSQGVQRSPMFLFESVISASKFVQWMAENENHFVEITQTTSRFAQLKGVSVNMEGNAVTLLLNFYTGDAAGQNMVTICTDAICTFIIQNSPLTPTTWYVEGNLSGDKKATARALQGVRGKKVVTEIDIPKEVVSSVLKSTPENIARYWHYSTMNVIQSGAIGSQGHYANGLAALFLATGQDVACVSEASIGITRMSVNEEGGLYVSVTLPNLIVGTVGGGTSLPTQKECLEMMGCFGLGKAVKFAEICGAVVLCGEISIAAALAEGHFTSAHQKLGRK